MLRRTIVAALASAALGGLLLVGPVFAGEGGHGPRKFGYGYRPGWGFGDGNHDHTGPPGLIKKNKQFHVPPVEDVWDGLDGEIDVEVEIGPDDVEVEIDVDLDDADDIEAEDHPGRGKGKGKKDR
jgi:hypothetical protein